MFLGVPLESETTRSHLPLQGRNWSYWMTDDSLEFRQFVAGDLVGRNKVQRLEIPETPSHTSPHIITSRISLTGQLPIADADPSKHDDYAAERPGIAFELELHHYLLR